LSAGLASCLSHFNLAREESMDVTNDPRFFAASVMDKRLGAFKNLTLVSGLMFASSVMQCFKLKKDFDLSAYDPLVGYIGWWQLLSFLITIITASLCLFSLYVISHQFFFANRFRTSSPTGFEQASVFYLTRVIVMWRHIAIKCLFHGISLFMFELGLQLFTAFYKDADAKVKKANLVFVANVVNGNSMNTTHLHYRQHHKLDMGVHSAIAYIILFYFLANAFLLIVVRRHHIAVFQENYRAVKVMTAPLEGTFREMAYRGGDIPET